MKKVLKFILYTLGIILLILMLLIFYIVNFKPRIPVENITISSSPERLKRGKYLVDNVVACTSCHSKRDETKYTSPIMPYTEGEGGEVFDHKFGFPGTFVALNITPYGLRDWTDGEILRAITCGVSKDNSVIFPVMPYLNYGKMDREDIYSVIAYLRTLKPIQSNQETSRADFPMNIILHLIPQPAKFKNKPSETDRVNYGRYLANAASCAECHTKFEKGQLVENMQYGGGREFKMPFGKIWSANITPDKNTGIGKWTKEAFIEKFKSYDLSKGYKPPTVGPTDYNTIMPWTSYAGMTNEDLGAIYDYLQTVKPISNMVMKAEINK